jgi:hypothetical protein
MPELGPLTRRWLRLWRAADLLGRQRAAIVRAAAAACATGDAGALDRQAAALRRYGRQLAGTIARMCAAAAAAKAAWDGRTEAPPPRRLALRLLHQREQAEAASAAADELWQIAYAMGE